MPYDIAVLPDAVRPAKRAATTVTRIASDLRVRLAACDIPPGTRINEVALARTLAISRTPLREALHRLATERLLTFEPNRGFSSRPLCVVELEDLYEARIVIEVASVRMACERARAPDVAALSAFWATFQENLPDRTPDEVAAADIEFHERLCALGGNAELAATLRGLNARTLFVRCLGIGTYDMQMRQRANHHGAVMRALAAHDADDAAAILTHHIRKREGEVAALVREGNLRFEAPERLATAHA